MGREGKGSDKYPHQNAKYGSLTSAEEQYWDRAVDAACLQTAVLTEILGVLQDMNGTVTRIEKRLARQELNEG